MISAVFKWKIGGYTQSQQTTFWKASNKRRSFSLVRWKEGKYINRLLLAQWIFANRVTNLSLCSHWCLKDKSQIFHMEIQMFSTHLSSDLFRKNNSVYERYATIKSLCSSNSIWKCRCQICVKMELSKNNFSIAWWTKENRLQTPPVRRLSPPTVCREMGRSLA